MVVRTQAGRDLLRDKRMAQMEDKLRRIGELKEQLESMGVELEALELEVVPVLKDYQKKGYTLDGDTYTGVTPTRTYFDEPELRRDLGEETWKQIETVSFDRQKLSGLVAAGIVKASVLGHRAQVGYVAAHATIKPTKPYVLVTRKSAGVKGKAEKAA